MPTGIITKCGDKLFLTNQALTSKILENPSFPFTQKNDVFVYEYFHGRLLKGSLLLLASAICMAVYLNLERLGSHSYTSFFLFSMGVSLWLVCSGVFRRRLVIDHGKGEYRFYIHTHLRHRGPLNQIYVRIIAQKCQGNLMFRLILNGYKIDCHSLSGFSKKYRLLECQGRILASNLKLNYFNYEDTSRRHCVIHYPEKTEAINIGNII